MMSGAKKRVPQRRFKEFLNAGAWEQCKLRNLLEQPITDGPHETPELYNSGIPFISVDAIVDNKIDFTKMRGYISKEYDDICAKKYKPQINDVYLVKSGATIGKVAIVDTYDDFNIWSPLAAMRCGSITNPYFLYILLQTQDLQSQVFNKASHGTQPNLSMRQLEQFTCKVPKIEEQKLISRFLKQLDDVITLHQRKLDKLQVTKKALLQEMFPEEGQDKPKRRFKGFTDAWKQRKLSDILKVNSGKDYKHLDQGNIPVYGTGGYMLSVNESLSNIDAIGIGRKGTIDKPQYLKAPFWTVDTLFYLTALGQHSILFLYYLMQLIPWKKFDESTGVPSLSRTTIDSINAYVPSNSKEEELISVLFNQLDKSITLHQRKLDKLKNLKQAYLNEMFV